MMNVSNRAASAAQCLLAMPLNQCRVHLIADCQPHPLEYKLHERKDFVSFCLSSS